MVNGLGLRLSEGKDIPCNSNRHHSRFFVQLAQKIYSLVGGNKRTWGGGVTDFYHLLHEQA